MKPGTHRILIGDVMAGLATLGDGTVQTCITSPPYWGLRDYGCEGQIGLEPTPAAYLERMVAVFREVRRVLRDDGTAWVNMGDGYAGARGQATRGGPPSDSSTLEGNGHRGGGPKLARLHAVGGPGWGMPVDADLSERPTTQSRRRDNAEIPRSDFAIDGLKPKDLIGMPWRLAFALQADGWYLRSDIIWAKPNPMPESVRDRPTKSHEYLFLLAKAERYYWDAEAVKEDSINAGRIVRASCPETAKNGQKGEYGATAAGFTQHDTLVEAGRNIRTVWTIPTQPFPDAHFATYPEALVEPCVKAGTSERGCCPKCGAGWVRDVERTGGSIGKGSWVDHSKDGTNGKVGNNSGVHSGNDAKTYRVETVGWSAGCECNAGAPVPCTVLDPFTGSGTTGAVACRLGRNFIGCELNPEYAAMAEDRIGRACRPNTHRSERGEPSALFGATP